MVGWSIVTFSELDGPRLNKRRTPQSRESRLLAHVPDSFFGNVIHFGFPDERVIIGRSGVTQTQHHTIDRMYTPEYSARGTIDISTSDIYIYISYHTKPPPPPPPPLQVHTVVLVSFFSISIKIDWGDYEINENDEYCFDRTPTCTNHCGTGTNGPTRRNNIHHQKCARHDDDDQNENENDSNLSTEKIQTNNHHKY